MHLHIFVSNRECLVIESLKEKKFRAALVFNRVEYIHLNQNQEYTSTTHPRSTIPTTTHWIPPTYKATHTLHLLHIYPSTHSNTHAHTSINANECLITHLVTPTHTHRLILQQMQQQPLLSYTQIHTPTHSLPPAWICLHCQADTELSQHHTLVSVCVCVCVGNSSLSRSTVVKEERGGTLLHPLEGTDGQRESSWAGSHP